VNALSPDTRMGQIRKVGVLGCGLMGSGIAQAAAAAGFPTVARDVNEPLLEKGRTGILKSLGRLVEKGKLPAATRDTALARLSFATDLSALADCDIIIEAVTEDLELKNRLWRELDRLCGPHAIFASNTSSLTIADMAAVTRRPDRFVGLHFFNPVPLMPLVEVVRTAKTSSDTFDRALAFARALGKEPVAAVDRPGFIVNLLLVPYLLDATRALGHGVASTTDLDRAMQLGCGHPMGPLTLLDTIGLDTVVRIADIMFEAYRDERYAAPPLLRRMTQEGLHGRKSGKGFYDYSVDPPVPVELGVGSQESGASSLKPSRP
jgi:3-hydroxybutyryl-CoA dehydrogenase